MLSDKLIVLSTGVAAALTVVFLYNWMKSKKKPPEKKSKEPTSNNLDSCENYKIIENPSAVSKTFEHNEDDFKQLSKKEEFVHEWVNNNSCSSGSEVARGRSSNSDSCCNISAQSCEKRKRISDSDSGSPEIVDEVMLSSIQCLSQAVLDESSCAIDIYSLSTQPQKQAACFQHVDSEEDSGFQKKGIDGDSNSASSKDACDELTVSDKVDTPSDPVQIDFPTESCDQSHSYLTMPPWDQDEDISSHSLAEEMVDSLLREEILEQEETKEAEEESSVNKTNLTDSSQEQSAAIDSDVVEYIDNNGMRRTLHFFAPEDMPEEFSGSCIDPPDLETEMQPREGEIMFVRCVPQQFCGLIFGRRGRNAKELRDKYDCRLQLTSTPYDPMSHTLQFVCPEVHLYAVERWFRHKIRICQTLGSNLGTNVANPLKLLKRLPLGEVVPVFVLGMESPTELYVQIYDPKEYENFQVFQSALDQHYLTEDCPHLPSPVGRGAICIAPYLDGHFYRVRITDQQSLPSGEIMVTVFYLDFGGQLNHSISSLYKIKEEFMRFPFQSILVRWAHAESLVSDPSEVYTQLFQNRSLYAHAVTVDTMDIDHAVFFASTGAPNELVDLLQEANASGLYGLASYTNCRLALSQDTSGRPATPMRYWPPQIGSVDYTSLLDDLLPDIEECEELESAYNSKSDNGKHSFYGGRKSKLNRQSPTQRSQQTRGRENRYGRHPTSRGRGHNPAAGETRKLLKS